MGLAAIIALALAVAPATEMQPASPGAAASAFLDAFRAMDKARFDGFFAPQATMFFPDGPFPKGRVEGRDAVLTAFHDFFARARRSGRKALDIKPLDLRVEQHDDFAVVTFWLDSGDAIGRRSLLFRRIGSEWRIVHFHASTADK